jgi:hypothetical protein
VVRWIAVVSVSLLLAGAASGAGSSPEQPVWGAPVLAGALSAEDSEAFQLLTVDLNGDGLRDIVVGPDNSSLGNGVVPVAPVFLLNSGGGRFVEATRQLFVGAPPAIEWDRELLTADFNRDGRPDLFIADHGHVNDSDPSAPRHGAQQHLVLSMSDARLVDATANLPQQKTFTHSAAVADVNGDGAPDIFENNLGCCSDGHVQAQILLNDGTGRFTVEPDGIRGMITDVYGSDHSYACLFADVNGDGASDLVLGGSEAPGANGSQVLLGDGHGYFSFFETLPPTLGPANNAFVIDMKAIDINGDGAPDLVFAESLNDPWYQGASIQILVNDGHGRFTDQTAMRFPDQPQTDDWPERVLVDDVNDDGRPDITVHLTSGNPTVDPTLLYLNDNGVFRKAIAPQEAPSLRGGPIGWVNGDGPHALFSVEFNPIGEATSHYYVTPEIIAPATPTGVRAVRAKTGVRLSWTRVAGATSYEVRRGGKLVATTGASSWLDRKPGKRPRYTLRAVNAAGASRDNAPVTP